MFQRLRTGKEKALNITVVVSPLPTELLRARTMKSLSSTSAAIGADEDEDEAHRAASAGKVDQHRVHELLTDAWSYANEAKANLAVLVHYLYRHHDCDAPAVFVPGADGGSSGAGDGGTNDNAGRGLQVYSRWRHGRWFTKDAHTVGRSLRELLDYDAPLTAPSADGPGDEAAASAPKSRHL